jgi:hypothetical protein
LAVALTLKAYDTTWKDDLKRTLAYVDRLRFTDPKLAVKVLADVVAEIVDKLP